MSNPFKILAILDIPSPERLLLQRNRERAAAPGAHPGAAAPE